MAISGIYAIVNKINGHRYVGSSSNITERWKRHVSRLENKNHHSRHLQHAWDYYGRDSFDFIVIAECAVSARMMGYCPSEETRRKLSEINRTYRHTDEAKRKIGEAARGNNYASHKHTPEEIEHQRVKMQEYWARRKATTSAESKY